MIWSCSRRKTCPQVTNVWHMQDAAKKLGSCVDTHAKPASVVASLRERLSGSQQSGLLHNSTVFSLLLLQHGTKKQGGSAGSVGGCVAAAQALAEASPHSEAAIMLLAAATATSNSVSDGIDVLKSWLAGDGKQHPMRPTLLAAHLALVSRPPEAAIAIDLLRSSALPGNVRFAPALVATRAALAEAFTSGGDGSAKAELQEALTWWEGQPAGEQRTRACCGCLEQLGAACLRQGDTEAAMQALRKLQVCLMMKSCLLRLPASRLGRPC
jgi:hypothetical protein